jgi:CRP-like cAMP-binding protein
MTNVGAQCGFLKVSGELKTCLQTIGTKKQFAAGEALFREDEGNAGIFLLLKGKVRMTVKSLPRLDRLFSAGSLLGLPSTFTGRPYSLTSEALTDVEAIHVTPENFLDLMRERPNLCGEATEMLGREVTFIQSALAERHKQAARKKVAGAVLV